MKHGSLRSWRMAVQRPLLTPRYQRLWTLPLLNYQHIIRYSCAAIVFTLSTIFIFWKIGYSSYATESQSLISSSNTQYPRSKPIVGRKSIIYQVALIADLDQSSKIGEQGGGFTWVSYYLSGRLSVTIAKPNGQPRRQRFEFTKAEGKTQRLTTMFNIDGRGMELSELIYFDGKLLSPDDRTGILYELKFPSLSSSQPTNISPLAIFADGNGQTERGFKGEWCTVKDGKLYIGGLGKPWTSPDGKTVLNHDPMYIKIFDKSGHIQHVDWKSKYEALMRAAGVVTHGYMIHEAVVWSPLRRRWYFAPRRISRTERYDAVADEMRGSNLVLTADEHFTDISSFVVNYNSSGSHGYAHSQSGTRGFSSIKFVPDTADSYLIALRSEEFKGKIATYISSFDLTGAVVMAERIVEDGIKYEGIEFV